MTTQDHAWIETNQRYLSAAIERLAERLARRDPAEAEAEAGDADRRIAAPAEPLALSALDNLQAVFGLTAFEREIVLLCAGFELDPGLAERHGAPSFGLALSALPDPHWSALTPARPLRLHRLIEPVGPGPLVSTPLRIDERVLHYLCGARGPDARLDGVIEPLVAGDALVPSHARLADAIARAWESGADHAPVIELWGPDGDARRAIAAAACDRLCLALYRLDADGLGRDLDERLVTRLLTREALLDGVAYFIDGEYADPGDAATAGLLRRLAERVQAPIVLATRERGRALRRASLALEVQRPTTAEQRAVFRDVLAAEHIGDELSAARVDRVVSQFDLDAAAIRTVCAAARRSGAIDVSDALWDTCRGHARSQLDDLAQRIEARVGWRDLVVAEPQRRTLHEIVARVRQRSCVYDRWGFAARGTRGLGITALFAGPSGTGKTLAAEVLARELRLDLYRVDLSQVVSKYIGETERNLRRVFDAAEQGAAVLLFDEADALFGKRSEVQDSHDRYANIEIGYLLQRMEAYRGLAILTTNLRSALDQAFVRRLAFVVEFPMPDAALRGEIWRSAFPAGAPTDRLDFDQLARLGLSGGTIRNVALAAAFLAADADQPVRMEHVVAAARGEFAKLERPAPSELARLA
jgi:hypothetical protein